MTNTILSATLIALAGITTACQPSSYARPTSGIQLRMTSTVEGGSQYAQGRLRVQSLNGLDATHVLVGPPRSEQRVELPPGAYSVSYEPLRRPGALEEDVGTMKVVSPNPLVIVVAEDQFTPIHVRMIDAEENPVARSDRFGASEER